MNDNTDCIKLSNFLLFEIIFAKMNWKQTDTRGKFLAPLPRYKRQVLNTAKTFSCKAWIAPVEYSLKDYNFDMEEFRSKTFNQVFYRKFQEPKHYSSYLL